MLIRQIVLFATHFAHVMKVYTTGMEGFIVNGKDSSIEQFPHSVFLAIECFRKEAEQFACGGSIISQYYVLTAAHCFAGCHPAKTTVIACIGATNYAEAINLRVADIKMHEEYSGKDLINDIALILLKNPIDLNNKAQKVYLMKNAPTDNVADVAGWGLIDEKKEVDTLILKGAVQKVISKEECVDILHYLPQQAFCTTSVAGYAAEGDSGSALVIRKFIQIGLVSYKDPEISESVIVYTNVSSYFDWIRTNMYSMNCKERLKDNY